MEIKKNELIPNKKFNMPSKIKSYKIEKELCIISNAHICLATNLNIKEKVLIKIYDKEILHQNTDLISLINNEIFMMKIINHKNILKLYEIIESPSYIFLIMEYFNIITLSDYIKSKKKFTEDESLNIYKQVISILLYFHDMNIGHLNLNPNEILIDSLGNIRLCDFKYSVFYTSTDKVKCKYIGDMNYLSPEILSEKTCFPEYADIWSSGVILYLLLFGQLPFKGINKFDLQKKIMGAEFLLPLNISKNLQEFIKNIFEVKTDVRYNLENILSSALFKDKKINRNNLPKGLNVFSTKYPIDDRIMNICKSNYDIDIENLKQKLFKNIFDPQTSLYKQIMAKFIRKKISTEGDLFSKKFNNYIENKKNILEDGILNKNIQENLTNLEEMKNGNMKILKDLGDKYNLALIKLEDLFEKYKDNNNEEKEEKEKKIDKEDKENNENENQVKNKNIIENEIKKEENKENIPKNKNNENKNTNINTPKTNSEKKYKRRVSVNINKKTSKNNKLNTYENQINTNLNLSRRKSSTNDIEERIISKSLEKINSKEISQKKTSEYLPEIKEVNLEEKKEPSPDKNGKTNSKLSINKSPSKNKDNNIDNNTDIENLNVMKTKSAPINKEKEKDLKISTISSITSKNNKTQKEKKNSTNNNATKAKTQQVTKEEFFKQIKNVKLKKNTPNTYINPDEIKRKSKDENKNTNSVENTKVSVENVLLMVETDLNNSKKNRNNLSAQPRKDLKLKKFESNTIQKKGTFKNERTNENNFKNKPERRESTATKELEMFKNKGIIINKSEIKNIKSKDDVSRFKFKEKKENDFIVEEDLNEIVFPRDYKTERRIKEERRRKYEEKTRKEEEERRKKRELEEKARREYDEKRRKDLEEKKKKELEEKKKQKEKEEKIKREKEERRRKEMEERQQKEQEELRLRLLEEERIKKELEEEERMIRKREEEEERQRLAEEEMRRKREEERERKIKEREEEDKRNEDEERIRKEKEKERIKLEEEEKIRKWKLEAKLRKEKEEKEKKEEEERERKEEEERMRKRKEESEKKRREMQEENRRRLEEYENMRKAEDDKIKMREKMRKKKDYEIRKKLEIELKEKRESSYKKSNHRKQSFSDYESSSSSEEEKSMNDKQEIKKKLNMDENQLSKSKPNNNKYTLSTNPFEIYRDQYSEDSITPKVSPKKNVKKAKAEVQVIEKKRKTGPKLVDLNKFRESDLYPEEESSEENLTIRKRKSKINDENNNLEKTRDNKNLNHINQLYGKFTDFFFNSNIYSTINNKSSEIRNKEIKPKNENKNRIFYRYQKNQGKEEIKSIIERSIQQRNQNIRNNSNDQRMNVLYSNYNNYNKNNKKNIKQKKKVITETNNIKPIKMKISKKNNTSKNNLNINEKDYWTKINGTSVNLSIYTKPQNSNKSQKNNNKKAIAKIKTDIAKIRTLNKNTEDLDYINNNMKNSTINNNTKLNGYNDNKKHINNFKSDILDYNSNSLLSNSTILSKNKHIKNFNSVIDFDEEGTNKSNKSKLIIKKNSQKFKVDIKQDELSVFKGKINYNNISAKNLEESLNDLITKYKSKGYTCVNKNKNKYKFIKGPNIHNVEIMRLGNGLLYFNINK